MPDSHFSPQMPRLGVSKETLRLVQEKGMGTEWAESLGLLFMLDIQNFLQENFTLVTYSNMAVPQI